MGHDPKDVERRTINTFSGFSGATPTEAHCKDSKSSDCKKAAESPVIKTENNKVETPVNPDSSKKQNTLNTESTKKQDLTVNTSKHTQADVTATEKKDEKSSSKCENQKRS